MSDAWREEWGPGDAAWFEYHCNESPVSADAQLWYRSHQQVTVVAALGTVLDWPGSTFRARQDAGAPRYYRVRFADGFEGTVFEHELLTRPEGYYRPGPPRGGLALFAAWDGASLLPDEAFASLSDEEERSLRAWARQCPPNAAMCAQPNRYHPVIRDEWRCATVEAAP